MGLLKKAKIAYITISILMLVLGGILLIWPEISLSLLCMLIGVVTLVFGIVKLIGYFSNDLYRLAFQFDFASGILSMLIGGLFLIHPEHMAAILPTIMGVFILVDGVLKIQTAVDARAFGFSSWWMIIFLAAATGICGFLLIWKPFEGAVAMMMLLGVTLLIDGIQNLWVVLYSVKSDKKRIIDADYREL